LKKKKESRPTRPTAVKDTLKREVYATVTFLEKVQETNQTNYIVMIDKSGSMGLDKNGKETKKLDLTRWTQSSKVVSVLAQACCATSPDGISIYFFGSPGKLQTFTGIKSQTQVIELFSKNKPGGTTCLEGSLAKSFEYHFARKDRLSVATSILVITDGWPDSKSAVIQEIISASKKCQTATEISVSFMQVGADSKCGEFFKKIRKIKK